jgi:Na+/proline symporter
MAFAHWELHSYMIIVLGWVFAPFYLRSKIFTTPEFLEKRYTPGTRTALSLIFLAVYILTKASVTVHAGAITIKTILGFETIHVPLVGTVDFFWFSAFALVRRARLADHRPVVLVHGSVHRAARGDGAKPAAGAPRHDLGRVSEAVPGVRSEAHLVTVGRIATVAVVVAGIARIPIMQRIGGGQLYGYLQNVQSLLSPAIAAVFMLGIFSRSARSRRRSCTPASRFGTSSARPACSPSWRRSVCTSGEPRASPRGMLSAITVAKPASQARVKESGR